MDWRAGKTSRLVKTGKRVLMYDYGWGIQGVGKAGNKGMGCRKTNSQICMDARAKVYDGVLLYEQCLQILPEVSSPNPSFSALQVRGTSEICIAKMGCSNVSVPSVQ